jgi:hypothetical protein
VDEWTGVSEVARRDGPRFDCATWLHKAREMPKEDFRREVEKELPGKEEEPSELIYFKIYKSQIPVIEQAMGTAALILAFNPSSPGTDSGSVSIAFTTQGSNGKGHYGITPR